MNRSDLLTTLTQLASSNRPPALVTAAGYLIFSEMRLDPLNPQWAKGDILLFSEEFTETVHAAYQRAGASADTFPQAGFGRLTGDTLAPRRVFCLANAGDASQLSRLADYPGTCVFCPDPPVNSQQWQVVSCEDLTLDALQHIFASPIHGAMWIVAPMTGSTLLQPQTSGKKIELADRMSWLGTESAFDVLKEVFRLRDEGRDIVSFGLGEPDFDTPSHIKEAAKKALDQNETHYVPSAGIAPIRTSIANYIQRTRRIPVSPAEIVVAPGAKPIIFDVMMALINPGDEVLYPNPGYPIYESLIDWVGGVSVPLPLWEDKNWSFSIEDLASRITPKTKMMVLNSPGNPTGTLLSEATMRDIARLAIEHDMWVIADEIYSQILFGEEFVSIASLPGMKERSIIIDGFSKTYAMTGWRLGYGVMPEELAVQIAKIETNIDSCTCAFTQIAGVHALNGPQHEALYMVQQFAERSRVIVDLLNGIDGVHCLPAQGAFYVFPNVTGACRRLGLKTSNELQHALLHEAGVAVLPRTCFGRRNDGENEEYIRLSFATSMETIREGLRRMKQFIEK
jgi:aspartate aminotransferase